MSDVRLARDGVRSLRGRSRPAPHSPNHEPDSAALTTSAERKLKLAQIGLRRVCAGVRKHRGGARTHDGRYSIGGRRRSGGRAESCRANQHGLRWRRRGPAAISGSDAARTPAVASGIPLGWLHARRDTTAAAHATLRGIAARSRPDGPRNTTMASAVIR